MHVTGVSKGEGRVNRAREIFGEINAKNFPKLIEDIKPYTKTQRTLRR